MTAPPRIRDSRVDLEALIDATASASGINPAFVEKDFWVIETLRAALEFLGNNEEAAGTVAIFKGGTSLSRVFGIVERFSEDIDLLLSFPEGLSKGARERSLKGVGGAVARHLDLEAAQVREDSQTKGVSRNVRFLYPATKESGEISDGVYLEMGNRGGPFPTSTHTLRSMIANHAIDQLGGGEADWQEFASLSTVVLAPVRTLLEKLALVTTAAALVESGEANALSRHGRHLYDIYRLLGRDEVMSDLETMGRAEVAFLAADIHNRSIANDWKSVQRPEDGYGSHSAFNGGAASAELETAFVASLPLIYGERPTFRECVVEIVGKGHLL